MQQAPDSAQVINPNAQYQPPPIVPPSEQPLPQLYIDTSSKCFLISIYTSFILTAFIFLASSTGVPRAEVLYKPNDIICPNPVIISSDKSIQCLPFDVYNNPNFATYVPRLTNYNQYLEIYIYFYVENMNYGINIDDEVFVAVFSTTYNNGVYYIEKEVGTFDVEVEVDGKSAQFKQNSQVVGYYQKLGYLQGVPAENLMFVSSIPSLTESVNIKNVTLQVRTANPESTRMQYTIRIVFFCISILTFAAYAIRLSLMHRSRKVLEQRFIMVLGFTLILFNDPFFVITLTRTNNSSTFFSTLFYLIFPVALMFFFMCVFERADLQNSSQESFIMKNPVKWMLITITFSMLFGFYLYSSYNMSLSYAGNESSMNQITYRSLKGFSLILMTICYLVSFYHFIQICLQYQSKRQRYKTLLNISMFYFFYSFIAFISSSFCIFNNWPSITFLNFTIFNTYIYILQFLYSPTKDEIRRKYPSRLTNAEVMQRAGDYVANNYRLSEIGDLVGVSDNDKGGHRDKNYDKMSDQLRTDYRWSSMNDGLKYQQRDSERQDNNSMPDLKNYDSYEASNQHHQHEQVDNYEIQVNGDHNNVDNYQIQDEQEQVEEYKIDQEKYYYDENNEHEKAMQDPEEDQNQDYNQQDMKQSVLLSLSESTNQNMYPNIYVSQSDILKDNSHYIERGTVSNLLDDIYKGGYDQQQYNNQRQFEQKMEDFEIGEREINEEQQQQQQKQKSE